MHSLRVNFTPSCDIRDAFSLSADAGRLCVQAVKAIEHAFGACETPDPEVMALACEYIASRVIPENGIWGSMQETRHAASSSVMQHLYVHPSYVSITVRVYTQRNFIRGRCCRLGIAT